MISGSTGCGGNAWRMANKRCGSGATSEELLVRLVLLVMTMRAELALAAVAFTFRQQLVKIFTHFLCSYLPLSRFENYTLAAGRCTLFCEATRLVHGRTSCFSFLLFIHGELEFSNVAAVWVDHEDAPCIHGPPAVKVASGGEH